MPKHEYDVAVIGSGPGGYVAAIRAAQLGLKTVCIEKNKTFGGTCLNIGCIPSKTLLQSTEYYDWLLHESKELGITAKDPSIDFGQIMQRKLKVVEGLVTGVAGLFKRNNIFSVNGAARLKSPNQIEVYNGNSKTTVEADHIILATGSEPIPLPFLPFNETNVVSSEGALSLPKIPKKLLVIGAGVIGVEIGSVYKRLGSDVTFVEMMDTICPGMDATLCKSLQRILEKQGLVFHLSSQVVKGDIGKETVTLSVKKGDETLNLNGDVVLVAVGRKPYSDGLGLADIGVKTTKKGLVEIDGNFHTSVENIFAIGDLIEGPMLAHKASEEGTAAAEIIAGLHPRVNYMAIPSVIYTHPEVASLGMTEKEARDIGFNLKIGISYFKGNPRARCSGYTEGFVKVIGEESTGKLVGMHIIGAHASEMIGEGVLAIEKEATLETVANASHAHPTLCEAIKEAAQAALGRAIHG